MVKTSIGYGKRVPILALGERYLERNSDRRDQPGVVRVLRVGRRVATAGPGYSPWPRTLPLLTSRFHIIVDPF